jgi:hypothetical protein
LLGLGDSDVPVADELVFQVVRHFAALENPEHDRWLGWPLRRHLKADVPEDLIRLLIDRAVRSADHEDGSEIRELDDDGDAHKRDLLLDRGINTARGHLAEVLGDLLVHDVDGDRTRLVLPVLEQLASDRSLSVRSCVAHLIAACLRYARPEAIVAFRKLIDTDDKIFTTRYVQRLLLYIGNSNVEEVVSVIHRMLVSENVRVRHTGGQFAAYAGLELAARLCAPAKTFRSARVRPTYVLTGFHLLLTRLPQVRPFVSSWRIQTRRSAERARRLPPPYGIRRFVRSRLN